MIKMPDVLRNVLEEHDVDYELVNKKKHVILYIGGHPVCSLSRGNKVKKTTLNNTVSRVQRFLRSLECQDA